jgi:PKHD-type hydroxylase
MLGFPRVSGRRKTHPLFLEHPAFLNPAEVARLVQLSREIPFVDGRQSNPHNVTKVNMQADQTDDRYLESSRIVSDAFARSRPFQDFAIPKTVAPPLLSRYEAGMKYGPHADVAFMTVMLDGKVTPIRSDLSATVFLSEPRSYEGGELVLHIGTRPVPIKGAPGEAFIYPSTMLHEVRPVKSGQRLVSITFIESHVPDQQDRNTLFELKDVLSLEGLKMDWLNRVRMSVALENLTRQWSRR